jgi:DNA-binding PadR family transcriptional regulator
MANERISKLQRWILDACLQDVELQRTDVWAFFGRRFSPRHLKDNPKHRIGDWEIERHYGNDKSLFEQRAETVMEWRQKLQKRVSVTKTYYIPKKQFVVTPANDATISRTLKNLVRKGLLERPEKYGRYTLTERGFATVKKINPRVKTLNFKGYQKKVTDRRSVRQKAWNSIGIGLVPSVAKKEKMMALQEKSDEFRKKFTTATIYTRLCDRCQKKITKFEKACGAATIERLQKEISRME